MIFYKNKWIISTLSVFSEEYTIPVLSFSEIFFLFAMFVIFSRDAIYCLLALIFLYVLAAILLLSYNLEFLAFALIIVSLGAVAVLFLYVVLMVNLKGARIQESMFYKFNICSFLLGMSLIITVLLLSRNSIDSIYLREGTPEFGVLYHYRNVYEIADADLSSPLKLYGLILYDNFFILFVLIGVLLLVALIGCILLTHTYKFDTNKE